MATPVQSDAIAEEGIPVELGHIEAAIESSRPILTLHLPPEWDDGNNEP